MVRRKISFLFIFFYVMKQVIFSRWKFFINILKRNFIHYDNMIVKYTFYCNKVNKIRYNFVQIQTLNVWILNQVILQSSCKTNLSLKTVCKHGGQISGSSRRTLYKMNSNYAIDGCMKSCWMILWFLSQSNILWSQFCRN